jgi:ABC-type multidrug transport system fused ATPase/permease subunit
MFLMYGFASTLSGLLIVDSRIRDPNCRINPTLGGCFTGANVVQTLMSVLIGSMMLGQVGRLLGLLRRACVLSTPLLQVAQVGPALSSIASAQAAAMKLFMVIDRVPTIDPYAEDGEKPDPATLQGHIEFRHVTFAYPSRPTELVLRDFSLVIAGGSHVALVGESGR